MKRCSCAIISFAVRAAREQAVSICASLALDGMKMAKAEVEYRR